MLDWISLWSHLRATVPGVLGWLRLGWAGAGPGQVLQNAHQPGLGLPGRLGAVAKPQGLVAALDFLSASCLGGLAVVSAGMP